MASANDAEDDAAPHIDTEGEIATTVAASGGEDKNADDFAFDDVNYDDDDDDDYQLDNPKAIEFEAKEQALDQWLEIEKLREELEEEKCSHKREQEDRKMKEQAEAIERERQRLQEHQSIKTANDVSKIP